jgi:hypothetical protein
MAREGIKGLKISEGKREEWAASDKTIQETRGPAGEARS